MSKLKGYEYAPRDIETIRKGVEAAERGRATGEVDNLAVLEMLYFCYEDLKVLLEHITKMEKTIEAMQVVAWGISDQFRHYGERLSQEADTLDQVSDRNPPYREGD